MTRFRNDRYDNDREERFGRDDEGGWSGGQQAYGMPDPRQQRGGHRGDMHRESRPDDHQPARPYFAGRSSVDLGGAGSMGLGSEAYRDTQDFRSSGMMGAGPRSGHFDPAAEETRYDRMGRPAFSAGDYGAAERSPAGYGEMGQVRPQGEMGRGELGRGYQGQGRVGHDYGQGSLGQPEQSHRGKGPKGHRRSDERIKEDVSDALEDDHYVDASEVEVRVEGGEVTLSGTVSDRQQKRRAEDCAEQVRGVRDVHNHLRVQQGGPGQGGAAQSRSGEAGHPPDTRSGQTEMQGSDTARSAEKSSE